MTSRHSSVMVLGATGTIGQATHRALMQAGYSVVAPMRERRAEISGAVQCDMSEGVLRMLMAQHGCSAVISCLASRSGAPKDAWAVDHGLNSAALSGAIRAGVKHFVLLSAICVQKPKLPFQQAKLAFEAELRAAPLDWSIVRPTAFFKSLSGQLTRLQNGKPFLLFGDGALTACKPISDKDLGRYLVDCLDTPDRRNAVLPIGGPGPALTPREQGALLFDALGMPPKFKHVHIAVMHAIVGVLSLLGKVSPQLRDKSELARIGRYYATESMLVWNESSDTYDADGTPEFGSDTLAEHYLALVEGTAKDDRGAHAVF